MFCIIIQLCIKVTPAPLLVVLFLIVTPIIFFLCRSHNLSSPRSHNSNMVILCLTHHFPCYHPLVLLLPKLLRGMGGIFCLSMRYSPTLQISLVITCAGKATTSTTSIFPSSGTLSSTMKHRGMLWQLFYYLYPFLLQTDYFREISQCSLCWN